MDKGEYKYVAFRDESGNWRITVRNDDWNELGLDMEKADTQYPVGAPRATVAKTPSTPKETMVCNNCGSAMTHKSGEKNGNSWGGWFCTNGPKGCGAKPIWD